MIIVTGAAGFIGANLVKRLNDRGVSDILAVDNLTNAEKVKNLDGLEIADYMDKEEFYNSMLSSQSFPKISAVLHEGACSDTMAADGRYVLHNNFTFSKALYHFCQQHQAQYIYASSASVYGGGSVFRECPEFESTLNVYAYSKLLFDHYIRRHSGSGAQSDIQCVGLRYFNVYGPREQHKSRMASVAWHFRNQYLAEGRVRLFEGSGGYGNGEQRRDFVSVEDVVAVNMFMLENPGVRGIFNVGTGRCQSFNDVAVAVINTLRKNNGEDALELKQAVDGNIIEYIPMPDALKGKYQSFTEADISNLRAAGYDSAFYNVGQGVARYMEWLDSN